MSVTGGTRVIVLLLLYLALNDSDDRPLIIDQPEENLDPKPVFDELAVLHATSPVTWRKESCDKFLGRDD